ncbi:MAG: GNAT family N-acetyltransferase [Hyphomicrobiales bacterium]|nr:GNAT family N-acetyltransferase [Hyphomicrobiales bacterium]
MPPVPDPGLVHACEQRIVNAWPAPTTMLLGDWVVRMANGYSGRANSATPLAAGADLDDGMLDLIEGLFARAGLPPCVRVTPLAARGLRDRLFARGYQIRDSSFGMTVTLDDEADPAPVAGLAIEPFASDDWIKAVSGFQIAGMRNPAHLAAIVRGIRMPAAFATLSVAGEPAAFGLSVAERGMAEIGSVIVAGHQRGKGLGRALVRGLMGWAVRSGAATPYLQVDQSNGAAIALYRSLGFGIAYGYDTMVRFAPSGSR